MPKNTDYYANPADIPTGTLAELFLDAVKEHGDRPAYGGPGDSGLSYADVRDHARRGAGALRRLGLGRGARAAILSENRLEWALADWSCLAAGVADVPIYSTLPPYQVAYILEDSGATLVFVSNAEQLAKVRAVAAGLTHEIRIVVFDPTAAEGDAISWTDFLSMGDDSELSECVAEARRAEPDDVATMIYTSGTTGRPKGVMLTHANLTSNVRATERVIEIGTTDSSISFLPLSHVLQRMVDYLLFARGCTVTHGSIETVADDMKRLRPTLLVSVPRLYEKVYQRVQDAAGLKGRLVAWATAVGRRVALCRESGVPPGPSLRMRYAVADRLVFARIREAVGGRLRFFVSGGAALAPEINRFFLGAGVTILEGYGLTETSPVTNVNTLERFRIGTVGRPVPGTEVRIADDGEILIRGPQVMKGYHGQEDATRAAISEDGWFSTGDIGELSEDGYLSITDRKKDLFKTSGGKYIAPQQIENLLKQCAFVEEALVIGEGRNFPAALVVPAFERLEAWASEAGIRGERAELVADSSCQEQLQREIFASLEELAPFETPKKIGLIVEPFDVEAGTLTPTQKVRRSAVQAMYAELIETMYRPESLGKTVFVA